MPECRSRFRHGDRQRRKDPEAPPANDTYGQNFVDELIHCVHGSGRVEKERKYCTFG